VLGPKLKHEIFGAGNALANGCASARQEFRVIGVLVAQGPVSRHRPRRHRVRAVARAMELFNRDGLTEINLAYAEGASAKAVAATVEAC